MKTYVLTVSKTFPVKHQRRGQLTNFKEMIAIMPGTKPAKIHTIRSNYDLWKKRINKVNEGKAVISLRQWSGKPYNSPQIEFMQLGQGEVGYQSVHFAFNSVEVPFIDNFDNKISLTSKQALGICEKLARNDGLSFEDFKDWFKGYDLSKPMIIIHLTNFRY
jgi:hypothetical protein